MSYVLRDYQQKASDAAVSFFNNKAKKTNAIMVLPTGSGKSLIIADIAARLDGHTLVFQPSKEILEQNFKKLCSYGILDCSIYSASFNSKEISRITFATIGSVKNHPELFTHFKNIIVDECHLVNPKEGMYKDFFDAVKCKVLGLTATPYRLSSSRDFGSMLKFITRTKPHVFSEVIYHVQVYDLYIFKKVGLWWLKYVDVTNNGTVRLEKMPKLIDAAYYMLCWCIQKGFVKTNKEVKDGRKEN